MTKDDIMKLALESGFAKILDEHASEYRDFTFKLSQDHYPELERFANLVAAHKAEVITAEAYRCGHEVADELRRLHKSNTELLEALETIRDLYEYETSCGELASRLYDARSIAIFAIAKAEGGAA